MNEVGQQAVEHKIGFCTNPDGARIAFETFGYGPVLVLPPAYLAAVGLCDLAPDYRNFYETIARFHTVVIYDTRGAGLSDRNRTIYDLNSELSDLETIITHFKLDKVALFGASMGGPIAIAYAAKYPDRVTHLLLYGSYAYYGKFVPNEVKSSILSLLRQPDNWLGLRSFLSTFAPSSNTDEIEMLVGWIHEIATPESYASLIEMLFTLDASDLCPQVKAPTLIVHAKGDKMIDFKAGLELASLIPSARFMPWTSDHLGNVRDAELHRIILEFLGDPADVAEDKQTGTEPAIKQEHDVFISFAYPDKDAAAKIYNYLKSNGIIPFWCEELAAGQDYPQLLGEAIRNSKAFLLVVSDSCDNYDSVRKEATIAHNNKKTIIPVRIKDVLPKKLEYLIANSLFCDAFSPPLDKHLPKLTADVKKIVGSKAEKKDKIKK